MTALSWGKEGHPWKPAMQDRVPHWDRVLIKHLGPRSLVLFNKVPIVPLCNLN